MDADSGRFRRATAMAACHPPRVLPADREEIMKLLVRMNFMWVATTSRREVFADAGLFRPDFRQTEDIEMWFRVLNSGWGIVRAPGRVLGIKRERPEALSRQDLTMIESLQRVLRIVIDDERTPQSVREAAQARIHELDRWRSALSGDNAALSAGLKARRALGRLHRATLGRRRWLSEPPEQVRRTFPELEALSRDQ
jgi:hypothetical protein